MSNTKAQKYRMYLRSDAWKAKREDALKQADYRCQLCNRSGDLQVHHRTYERAGCERDGDLTVLCGGCHLRFHHPGTLNAGGSKKEARVEIDRQILLMFDGVEALRYETVRGRIRAPRAQVYSRVKRLVRMRELAWCRGGTMLCLYEKKG